MYNYFLNPKNFLEKKMRLVGFFFEKVGFGGSFEDERGIFLLYI